VCADFQKSGGSPTKRKQEEEGDSPPAKSRKGASAPKPQQDFEKMITDAETDMKVLLPIAAN
jgi:hypothetical protein